MRFARRMIAAVKRIFPLGLCLCVSQAVSPPPAGTAATSRGGGSSLEAAGGLVAVPGFRRAATRRLPGGPAVVLLFSGSSIDRAWERAGLPGGDEVLVEIFPWSDGLGLLERARLLEEDLRAVGWKEVSRSTLDGRVMLTSFAGGRVRGHILTPTRHIRVTASKRSAEFEHALNGSGDAG